MAAKRVSKVLGNIETTLALIAMILVLGSVVWGVVTRYITEQPATWTTHRLYLAGLYGGIRLLPKNVAHWWSRFCLSLLGKVNGSGCQCHDDCNVTATHICVADITLVTRDYELNKCQVRTKKPCWGKQGKCVLLSDNG